MSSITCRLLAARAGGAELLGRHCSAMGKAITVHQERALADRILEVYGLNARTVHTLTDRQKLFQEFEEVRRTGIGCDRKSF